MIAARTVNRAGDVMNLSYVCGTSSEPLLYKTIGAVLEDSGSTLGRSGCADRSASAHSLVLAASSMTRRIVLPPVCCSWA